MFNNTWKQSAAKRTDGEVKTFRSPSGSCIAAFSEECRWCFLDLHRRLFSTFKSWIQQFFLRFLHFLLTQITQITIFHLIIKEYFTEYCSCLWQLESTFLMSQVLLQNYGNIKKQHWNIPLYMETTLPVICIKEKKFNVIKRNLWYGISVWQKSDSYYFE